MHMNIMKYITYFFLIVVLAMTVSAPWVFAGEPYKVFHDGNYYIRWDTDPAHATHAVCGLAIVCSGPGAIGLDTHASDGYAESEVNFFDSAVSSATGTYHMRDGVTVAINYFDFYYGGIASLPLADLTSIETVDPYDKEIIATSSTFTTFTVTGYVGDYDEAKLQVHIQNSAQAFTQCADVICSFYSGTAYTQDFETDLYENDGFIVDYDLGTEPLEVGNYYLSSKIVQGNYCIFGVCLYDTTVVATSTQFTVATTTKADDLVTSNQDYIDDLFNGGGTFKNCGIADFDLFLCGSDLITWSFVPTPDAVSHMTTQLHDTVLTHFPLGYLTDFASIMATTSTSTLTVLNATSTLFGGAHIRLDLNGVLDQFLYATTGQFINSSAPSTDTLFDITYPYWKYVNYIALLFYILSRLVGSHLFGDVSKTVKEIKK